MNTKLELERAEIGLEKVTPELLWNYIMDVCPKAKYIQIIKRKNDLD